MPTSRPEAQLDRFLLRARVGYPKRDDEWRILSDRIERASDEVRLGEVVDAAGRLALQPEQWVRRVEPDQVVRQILDTVLGVAVAEWRPEEPLEIPIGEVRRFQRRLRHARA